MARYPETVAGVYRECLDRLVGIGQHRMQPGSGEKQHGAGDGADSPDSVLTEAHAFFGEAPTASLSSQGSLLRKHSLHSRALRHVP
jgi:hypothetical protein